MTGMLTLTSAPLVFCQGYNGKESLDGYLGRYTLHVKGVTMSQVRCPCHLILHVLHFGLYTPQLALMARETQAD